MVCDVYFSCSIFYKTSQRVCVLMDGIFKNVKTIIDFIYLRTCSNIYKFQ